MKTSLWRWGRYATLAFVSLTIFACALPRSLPAPLPQPTPTVGVFKATPTPLPQVPVTFRVRVPQATGQVVLAVLNEVTGINIAPQRYPMKRVGNDLYEAEVPATVGSVLKYRYERHTNNNQIALEALVSGQLVRYRLLRVDGPMRNDDIVARWNDTLYRGTVGRIAGKVTDDAGHPLADILVSAAGAWTFTLADGSYLLEGLPPGEHTLVAYALDGRYRTFQQRARVGAGASTPAPIQMAAAPLVNVTFHVIVPSDTIAGAPVRLAGNLYTLGNTFADLGGGLSTLANRMPVLKQTGSRQYTLTLQLPVGADVRYTFTLGDGYWNAEHDSAGRFVTRQLIVPPHDTEINDVVETWASGPMRAIWFIATVPPDTPAGDTVDLQLNPAVWTPPLPMWPLGDGKWGYLLSSPTGPSELGYRYCRAEQCGVSDEAEFAGQGKRGRLFGFTHVPQQLEDSVQWQWWGQPTAASTPQGKPQPREGAFWQGVALMPAYRPAWQPYMGRTFAEIRRLHAHWVILTPTWAVTATTPPLWEPRPGTDPLVTDLLAMADTAHNSGMNIALFPQVRQPATGLKWWQQPHDFAWWVSWFDRYTAFTRHFAILAQRSHAGALVLGGEWVTPAVKNALPDGSAAGAPADLASRWHAVFATARQNYHGPIYWAMPLEDLHAPPAFLDAADGIYLLWHPDLGTDPAQWQATTASLLDTKVKPFAKAFHKPIVLVVAYPSAQKAQGGCLPLQGQCLPQQALFPETATAHQTAVNLERQTQAYAVLLAAINARPWISGIITADYYPPAALQGPSASVHGKPAAAVLGWWFAHWAP